MARGQKYNNEIKEKAMALLATIDNLEEVERQTGIPKSTLGTWKKQKEKDEEFERLRTEKKKQFVKDAWRSIEKAIKLGERRLDRALNHEKELDDLIDDISTDGDVAAQTKQALISKIRTLQIQTVKDISTFVGIMYDKAALANGEASNKTELSGPSGGPVVFIHEGKLED